MSYDMMVMLSYSIVPCALLAIYQLKYGDPLYRPILILLVCGLLNEIISTVVIERGGSNAINNNIYCLAEALLILTQFKKWGLFEKLGRLYQLLLFLIIAGWLAEKHSLEKLNSFLPYFRSGTGAMIVAMSIIQINKLITGDSRKLMSNACFIFCGAFCFYFSIAILVELFLYFEKSASLGLHDAVFKASTIANVITNIINLIAVLCIPRKHRFTT